MLPDEACGTLQYMAPELFVAGRPVDASIDIYAFGLLMWWVCIAKGSQGFGVACGFGTG